jgi:hypothetical protein
MSSSMQPRQLQPEPPPQTPSQHSLHVSCCVVQKYLPDAPILALLPITVTLDDIRSAGSILLSLPFAVAASKSSTKVCLCSVRIWSWISGTRTRLPHLSQAIFRLQHSLLCFSSCLTERVCPQSSGQLMICMLISFYANVFLTRFTDGPLHVGQEALSPLSLV